MIEMFETKPIFPLERDMVGVDDTIIQTAATDGDGVPLGQLVGSISYFDSQYIEFDIGTELRIVDTVTLSRGDWDVVNFNRPTVPLPNEAGYYTSLNNSASEFDGLLQLSYSGEWWWIGNGHRPNPNPMTPEQIRDYMPLARLGKTGE